MFTFIFFLPRRLGRAHPSLVSEIDVIEEAGSRTGHDTECERTFISIRVRRRDAPLSV